ncbi:MAG: hypothetical protein QOF60_2678 [Actinomycetota bacterium]|jgi:FlaG/FlaF family flagellin (archaellin)|nr:hypothetical protein [Actinomycetota bacterium]
MRIDIDDDLYPPDADGSADTPEARHGRKRAAIGTALVVWGTGLLVQRSLGVHFETFWLALGLGAFAGWLRLRHYGWFVAGAVLTAMGLGDVAGLVLSGAFASMASSLLLALGFVAVYVRYPHRSRWALVPAAVFAFLAVASFGIGLIGLVPRLLGSFTLPMVLIAAGGLLLFRHSLPPRTVRFGLIALAIVFVLAGTSNAGSLGRFGDAPSSTSSALVSGRTVELDAGSADVRVVELSGAAADRASVTGPRRSVRLVNSSPTRLLFSVGSGDAVLRVPRGTPVRVNAGSGDVSVRTSSAVRWSLSSDSGDVTVNGHDLDSADAGGSSGPEVLVSTGSGDIDLDTPAAG